jgi:hypothetical protein
VNFDTGAVTVTNHGDSTVSTAGMWYCQFPDYSPLPEVDVEPGQSLVLDATAINLGPAGGEVGLYTDNDFGASESIVSYVEWGEPNHTRSAVAVAAEVWDGGAAPAATTTLTATVEVPVAAPEWTAG